MAHEPLSELLGRFRRSPDEVRTSLTVPLLLWLTPGTAIREHWEQTHSTAPTGPSGEARVFYLRKVSNDQNNAFSLGVTVGRVDNNDLVLQDDSVSRFHAYFRLDDRQGWFVTDAESRNGTWVDGVKLAPNERAPVRDGCSVRMGVAELKFMLPASVFKMLERG